MCVCVCRYALKVGGNIIHENGSNFLQIMELWIILTISFTPSCAFIFLIKTLHYFHNLKRKEKKKNFRAVSSSLSSNTLKEREELDVRKSGDIAKYMPANSPYFSQMDPSKFSTFHAESFLILSGNIAFLRDYDLPYIHEPHLFYT